MKFSAGKNSPAIYSAELSGANTRQAMNREFIKLQRVISELSDGLIKLNKRIDELEAKQ